MNNAPFLSRWAAFVIDNIAMGLIAFAIAFPIAAASGQLVESESGILGFLGSALSYLLIAFLILFQFLYFGYFWSKNGQSIGMKLFNIKVVDRKGGLLTFLNAGLRGTAGYWLSGLFFSLGFLWALFDANNETWHDKLFGTTVQKA